MSNNARHAMPPSVHEDEFSPKELSKQEFGRKLVALMQDKNWNQSDLAREADVGRDAISTYVRGRSFPDPKNLAKIAKAFDMKPQDLYPNAIARAVEAEIPAIEIRQAIGQTDKVWLRVNRLVSVDKAAQIFALISEDRE